jgi:hypothetical protein
LQKKCPWHPGANHAAIDCYHLRRTFSNPSSNKKNKSADKEPEEDDQGDKSHNAKFIKFEVANFESSYHAILGRSALAKFMAVPHYVYLLLKMPGQSGVLTLRGDLKKSYDCNQEAIQYTSTTRVPDASGEVLAAAQQLSQAGPEIPTRKASKSNIQLTGDMALKMIQLQEGDSSKTVVIGAGFR